MQSPTRRDLAMLLALLASASIAAAAIVALPASTWIHVPARVVHAALVWASVFPSLAIAYVGIASRRSSASPLGFTLGLAFLASTCVDLAHPAGALAAFPAVIDDPRNAQVWTWTLARFLGASVLALGTSASASREQRRAELHGERKRGGAGAATTVALLSLALGAVATFSPPPAGLLADIANVVAALFFATAFVVYERAHRETRRPLWRSAAIAFALLVIAQALYVAIGEAAEGAVVALHLLDLVAKGILFAGLLRDHAFLGGRERELRRKLEGERRRLQRVLDATGDGILVVRHDDEIVAANPAAGALLGLSRGGIVVGKKMADVLSGMRVEYGHAFLLAEALAARVGGGVLERVERETGVVHRIESRYAPMPHLPGEKIDAAVVTLRDVTVQRELSAARASADAIRALLAERDEFLSVASHELKTPLTAAKITFGSLVARAERGEPCSLEALLRADRQVDRLTSLVDAMLDVSRMQTGRLDLARERFDWAEAMREVIDRVRLAHGDRANDVHVRIARGPLDVVGDRVRLVQVAVVLLENALKYSRSGGSVDVRVTESGDSIATVVRDQGIGIPAEDLADLFTRFRKGRNARALHYGGLGLSLYLAAEVVRRHGGTISVDSHEGEGSTFTFLMPKAAPATRPAASPVP